MPGGRPTKYKKAYANQADVACREGGFTDKKLAKLFGVTKVTIALWKKTHEEFSYSVKKGKDDFNVARAEDSLLKRLLGYRFTEVTKEAVKDRTTGISKIEVTKIVTKHVPPDVTANIFFLKNRDHPRWRDRHQLDIGVTKELAAHSLKLAEARARKRQNPEDKD